MTLSHPSFADDIRLVNNTIDITSRSEVYMSFPIKIQLPVDDGESNREVTLEIDNVSLFLVNSIRSVVDPISVKIEMILASLPDAVQISLQDLQIRSLTYNQSRISATITMDDFLNTEMTSERYSASLFPGIF